MLMRTAVEQLTWCVVFTGVRQEWRAAESLRQAGYQVFLPMRRLAPLPASTTGALDIARFTRVSFFGMGEHLPITACITDAIGVSASAHGRRRMAGVPPDC